MAAAWLLTLLALGAVLSGVFLGESRVWSSHVAAAGGGLLFGISLFWLIPDIVETSGWILAFGLALAACGIIAAVDGFLSRVGRSPGHGVIAPLLAATAVHSFLDGWSVRALFVQPVADIAVPIGLALHKVPEGLALGWITRRSLSPAWKAAVAAGTIESVTLAGALIEPRANQSGSAAFGSWWTAAVLAIIAGSFLFLGFHAVLPSRRNSSVIVIFLATFAAVACAAIAERRAGLL